MKGDGSSSVETGEAEDPASEFKIVSVDAQEYLNILFLSTMTSSINKHFFSITLTLFDMGGDIMPPPKKKSFLPLCSNA